MCIQFIYLFICFFARVREYYGYKDYFYFDFYLLFGIILVFDKINNFN